jgi:hypothetical protein
MLRDLRQRNEEYEPDILVKIRAQGGSEAYDNITEKLSAAGIAWISDLMLFQPDEKPWSIGPTPEPELSGDALQAVMMQIEAEVQLFAESYGEQPPPDKVEGYKSYLIDLIRQEIQDEAKTRSERMAVKIEDMLEEGGFKNALRTFLQDFVGHRAAFLEMTVQKVPKLRWAQSHDEKGSFTIPEVEEKIIPVVECFSPFDAYPSNEATSPQDGYFFRRFFPSRTDVKDMQGLDGYRDDMIALALKEWQDGKGANTASVDGERARLENKQNTINPHGDSTESLKFWGPVRGELLNQWSGNQAGEFDAEADYEISAIRVGRRVIKAQINQHPLKLRPIFATSYRKQNGSFWGKSVPRLVRKNQQMCNSYTRAEANNVAFAAGPILGIDQSKLPTGVDITQLHPFQVIPFENKDGSTAKVVDLWQAELIADRIENLLQLEYRKAEDAAGIPPYQYGQEKTSGAGQTLGGLEILTNASARGIKMAMGNIDYDVIKGVIREAWIYIMLYGDDESVKGDIEIKAKGALQMYLREQMSMRRMQLLSATSNPLDQQIKGILGRANELRELYKSVQVDPVGIVPDEQEMKRQIRKQEEAAALQQQQSAPMVPQEGPPQ